MKMSERPAAPVIAGTQSRNAWDQSGRAFDKSIQSGAE